MLTSKSKYYSYISRDEIEAHVLRSCGTIAICPVSFQDKNVQVRIFYKDRCEYYNTTVSYNSTRTFVSLPVLYEGKQVRIKLIQ